MEQTIVREKVALSVSDGTSMDAYVARPRSPGPHPGIIVLQEAYGVNSHIRDVTERFARQGFVAVAPELFHRTAPGFEGKYDDYPGALPHAQAVTLTTAEFDIRATFDWLGARNVVKPKEIYSVGFCLGGKAAFLANTILPLRATASFYGGGIAQELLGRAASVQAPMLLAWGGLDERIKPEHRKAVADALKENGKDYVYLEFSNADHGFFCDERRAYQPQAAEQAWSLLLEFLKSA